MDTSIGFGFVQTGNIPMYDSITMVSICCDETNYIPFGRRRRLRTKKEELKYRCNRRTPRNLPYMRRIF